MLSKQKLNMRQRSIICIPILPCTVTPNMAYPCTIHVSPVFTIVHNPVMNFK